MCMYVLMWCEVYALLDTSSQLTERCEYRMLDVGVVPSVRCSVYNSAMLRCRVTASFNRSSRNAKLC
jgi:hypothetical protein